jgi:hypothetical protein
MTQTRLAPQPRQTQTGRYMSKFETPCACGHTNGEHDAERVRHEGVTYQYCQHDGCECSCFRKARTPRRLTDA